MYTALHLEAQQSCQDCPCLLEKAKESKQNGKYLATLRYYNAFKACSPQNANLINSRIKELFDEVKRLQLKATQALKQAQQAKNSSIFETNRANKAEIQAITSKKREEIGSAEIKSILKKISDRLLLSAQKDIINLNYENAIIKTFTINASDPTPELLSNSIKLIYEIAYVYNEANIRNKSLSLADSLVNYHSQPTTKILLLQSHADSLNTRENLRNFLKQYNESEYEKMTKKYYPNMVSVGTGKFSMGSENSKEEDEKPKHEVSLDNFLIAHTETTFGQYYLFCLSTGKRLISPGWGAEGDNPAVNLSWYESVMYTNWLNDQFHISNVYKLDGDSVFVDWKSKGYRLPTEAEWEFAAGGGEALKRFQYSGSDTINKVAWYGENSQYRTHPVSLKAPNELGLFDFSGNVWEWCWDWYDEKYYQISQEHLPTGPNKGRMRVLRGGSWIFSANDCKITNRSRREPSFIYSGLGFRVARSATQ